MQAAPPKHLYSATVNNSTDKPANVTVTYKTIPGNPDKTVTQSIPANGSHTFGKEDLQSGSATFSYQIESIKAESDLGSHTASAPFVESPTASKTFHIKNDGGFKVSH